MDELKTINKLITGTEEKIIKILVGVYNSGRINEPNFNKYELKEIKNLLFMRNELENTVLILSEENGELY